MSRSLPQRFLSIVLALLVLAASVGLPVQRRTCRMSGRSTVRIAWGLPTQGQSDTPQKRLSHLLDRGCYSYSLHLHQLSAPAHTAEATKLLPAAPVWSALPATATTLFLASEVGFAAQSASRPWATATTRPARPAGRALLVRIGCWLV